MLRDVGARASGEGANAAAVPIRMVAIASFIFGGILERLERVVWIE